MATKNSERSKKTQNKSAAAVLREKKISACQEKLRHGRETLSALEAECCELLSASVVDAAVSHEVFGGGTVTAQDASTVTVAFSFGNKRFVMPSAFTDGFLTTNDAAVSERFARYQELCERIMAVKEEISITNRTIALLESK